MEDGIRSYLDLGFRTPIEEPPPPVAWERDWSPPEGGGGVANLPAPAPSAETTGAQPARSARGPRVVVGVVAGILVVSVALLVLFATSLRRGAPSGTEPGAGSEAWPAAALLLVILAAATALLGALSALLHVLRRKKNPLYWQLACWVLVVFGIASRQLVATSTALPTPGQLLVSIAVGIAVLPGLMRWLNRVSPKPGLQHVAVPYSLGFFLDLAQVLASSYVVKLPWIAS